MTTTNLSSIALDTAPAFAGTVPLAVKQPMSNSYLTFSDGNVGIGLATPAALFDVASRFQVDPAKGIYVNNQIEGGTISRPSTLYFNWTNSSQDINFNSGKVVIQGATGNVGVGSGKPAAKLDIAGEVKFGNTSIACETQTEGQQRYNSQLHTMEFCNGTTWTSMASAASSNSVTDPFNISGLLPEWEDANTIRFYDGCAANDSHTGTGKICFFGRLDTHFNTIGLNGIDGGPVPPPPGTIFWPFAVKCADGRQGVVWGRHQTWAELTPPCQATDMRSLPLSLVYTSTGLKQFNIQGWPGNPLMWFPLFNTDGDYDVVRDLSSSDWTSVDFSYLCSGSMRTLIVQAEAKTSGQPGTVWLRSYGTGGSGIPVTSATSSQISNYGVAWVQGNGDTGGTTRAGQINVKVTGGASATLRLMGCGQTGQ